MPDAMHCGIVAWSITDRSFFICCSVAVSAVKQLFDSVPLHTLRSGRVALSATTSGLTVYLRKRSARTKSERVVAGGTSGVAVGWAVGTGSEPKKCQGT